MRIGYACINLSTGYSSNRGMIKRTYLKDKENGLVRCSELSLENVKGLREIVKWNIENGIEVFRMTSGLFPWMSEYDFTELPEYEEIKSVLADTGKIAANANQRLSFHPGPFNILASPRKDVVDNTFNELNKHSKIMDMMGLPVSSMAKINIHIGAHYGDKASATKRWIENWRKLDENTRARLVVENDDKPGLYSVSELYELIHKKIGIPMTFDYLHHACHPNGIEEKEALEMSLSTWKTRPCTHYSSSKQLYEDENVKFLAHADHIYDYIDTYGHDIDVVLEAKKKDLAVLQYLEKHGVEKESSSTFPVLEELC